MNYKLSRVLMEAGYYCMNTVFPAVPMKNSGLRITVTNHVTLEDIEGILSVIAEALPGIMREEDYSFEQIYADFGMDLAGTDAVKRAYPETVT